MGLELLAEAGNYASLQRMYGAAAAAASMDLYYRQAAAAAALQKPLPYRLYPSPVAGPGVAAPSAAAAAAGAMGPPTAGVGSAMASPISTSSPLPTFGHGNCN